MVKKSVLEHFRKLGGYQIVKIGEDGKLSGVAEAARKTSLGEMTIRRIMKEHPQPKESFMPKYIEDFNEDEGVKAFDKYAVHVKKQDPETTQQQRRIIERAWIIIKNQNNGKPKDTTSWGVQEWQTIWTHPEFYTEIMPKRYGVSEGKASAFHNLMKAIALIDDEQGQPKYPAYSRFLQQFKGMKYRKGTKLEWYLAEHEIIGLAENFVDNECLMILATGIVRGGRFSSIVPDKEYVALGYGTPSKINWKDGIIEDFEPKMAKKSKGSVCFRKIPFSVLKLLGRYISDYGIAENQPLFTQSYSYYMSKFKQAKERYNEQLKKKLDEGLISAEEYAEKRITKVISSHILKHTFVSQASMHHVSIDQVSDQTGTDETTLKLHYKAKDEEKARFELQGISYSKERPSWTDWINSLVPMFEANYERIKKSGIVDSVRGKIHDLFS